MAWLPGSPPSYVEKDALVQRAIQQTRFSSVYGATSAWLNEIRPGYGRHVHDDDCPQGTGIFRCMADCDDSDLIIFIHYQVNGGRVWEVVYGVKDGGLTVWMD